MKIVEALRKAEKARNTFVWLRYPTKDKYGYMIRFTDDPMLEMIKINERIRSGGLEIDGKKYSVDERFIIPSSLVNNLIAGIRKLRSVEV